MFIKKEQLSAKWKRDLNLQKKKKKTSRKSRKEKTGRKKEM